ncbi:MAG: GtrA family protein [Firmicutes bacterium]|nr:GtrA family protein [Bacillota bacterium]
MIKKYAVYFKYLVTSGISFGLDLFLFTIFLTIFDQIIVASFLARAISSLINYILNKKKVFNYQKKETSTLIQYFSLVIINITLSSILVSSIVKIIPLYATIIKAIIDGLLFIVNFFLQKYFIFNDCKNNKIIKYILPIISFIAIYSKLNKNGLMFNYQMYEIIEMIILLPLLYYLYLFKFKKSNYLLINILSVILTLLLLFGDSYNIVHNSSLVYLKEIHLLFSLIKIYGYYFLIKNVLNYIYEFFINVKFFKKDSKFNKHPFLYSFIIISSVYSLYLLFFYPGVINYDNANQIKEVMGLHTRYLDSVVLLDENITLTNFNPLIHTLILGNLFKLGFNLGSVNFGLFLYTLLQMVVFSAVLAYSISFLAKKNVGTKYLFIMLGIYTIIPYFPFYAITAVKDTFFTSFVLLYIIKLSEFLEGKQKWQNNVLFFLILILVVLFRNNGIYLIMLSLPFLIFYQKNIRFDIIILTVAICLFYVGYNKTLTYFKIPNTSIREMLSVPFQQTAAYVYHHEEDVTKKEKEIIDHILGYDDLKERYELDLSDKVKNKYNKYATNEDLVKYFKVWFQMFLKQPITYIDATVNNVYGYFYPKTYKWYLYNTLNHKLKEADFDYHFIDLFESPRKVFQFYSNNFRYIPILKLTVNCGFYTYSYLFLVVLLFLIKMKRFIIILLPAMSLILMNVVGPANNYFRYCLPYAVSLPFIIGFILYLNLKKRANLKE